ncbi:hypothetical protein D3C78_1277200 [compost metagenome]
MRATSAVRVIGDEHVARQNIGQREFLHHAAYGAIECANKTRNAVALGDQLSCRISQANAVIQCFIDDRAHAGAFEGNEHLFTNSNQGVFNDFAGKWVGVAHAETSCTLIWI